MAAVGVKGLTEEARARKFIAGERGRPMLNLSTVAKVLERLMLTSLHA